MNIVSHRLPRGVITVNHQGVGEERGQGGEIFLKGESFDQIIRNNQI